MRSKSSAKVLLFAYRGLGQAGLGYRIVRYGLQALPQHRGGGLVHHRVRTSNPNQMLDRAVILFQSLQNKRPRLPGSAFDGQQVAELGIGLRVIRITLQRLSKELLGRARPPLCNSSSPAATRASVPSRLLPRRSSRTGQPLRRRGRAPLRPELPRSEPDRTPGLASAGFAQAAGRWPNRPGRTRLAPSIKTSAALGGPTLQRCQSPTKSQGQRHRYGQQTNPPGRANDAVAVEPVACADPSIASFLLMKTER